jgi:hypothetical protein
MAIELVVHPTMIDKLVQILLEAGLTLVTGQQSPADPAQIVRLTPAALWDATATERLLAISDRHSQLVAAEPYRTWLAARGGVAAVLARIESHLLGDLPAPCQTILRGMLDGEHYAVTAHRLFLSRAPYYRARQRTLIMLSEYLNAAALR